MGLGTYHFTRMDDPQLELCYYWAVTALVLMMLTYPKKAKSKLGGFFYNVGRAILIIFCCRFLMLGKFLANILPLIHFGLIKYFGLLYMNNSYAVKKTIVLGLHLR